ncbi:phospholipid carrier-dependent glycosyltransferase [Paenibacillus spiritus]|uniref:Phospholipid carrier-dependent glycosyltransferase n=1 Tax=Paenibacillus spiritus TaxID=2496557 RepID=A0A5J5FWA2_9BACL|nr:glycosyltransferase family 39 protein [Paenibacillus spiritus]KAA8997131.1 phospholipid carrier-dependent glycosyltransferase [Paenibacillus spiritus]
MLKVRRIAAAVLTVWLVALLAVPGGIGHAAGNMLNNSGFEELDGNAPAGWTRDAWVPDEAAGTIAVESEEVHSGRNAAVIENVQQNHAKWLQTVAVKPDSLYRISGWIKVVSAGAEGFGANIVVAGLGSGYPALSDTGGQWEKLEFVGRTGGDQKEISIGPALGGYGSLNTGKAYFDDISIEELSEAPAGASVISLDGDQTSAPKEESGNTGDVSPKSVLLFSALFTVFFVLMYRSAMRSRRLLDRPEKTVRFWFILTLAAAFVLRLWLGWTQQGYLNDMKTFMYWGQRVADLGPGRFYEEGVFADYPPGYLYILYLLHEIKLGLGLAAGSSGEMLLFKLPAIVADLITGVLLYRFVCKKWGSGLALALAALYLFNPAVLTDSAVWGQADSFFVLFLLLSIMAVADKRLAVAALWFAIATAVKPQALIFTPVLLFAFYHHRAWKELLKGALYGLAALAAIALPFFWGNGGIKGIIDLYSSTLSSYPYSTVNAFNLYTLIAPSWAPIDRTWLGIPFRIWGSIFIVVTVLLAGLFSFRKNRQDLSKSYYIAMLMIVVMFVLGTKMHERYMFPALILSLFAYAASRDRRLLLLFFGFSLTQYINVRYVLIFLNASQTPGSDGIVLLTSIANLGLLLYMLYVGWDIYFRGRVLPLPGPRSEEEQRRSQIALAEELRPLAGSAVSRGARMGRKDWIWMGAITVLYGALALTNLGSDRSPQTVWEPQTGSSVVVDLGSSQQLEKAKTFGGVGTGAFKLEFSETGDNWSGPVIVNEEVGNVFIWKEQVLNTSARYVRITATSPGFFLHEMAFYAPGTSEPLPVASAVDAGSPAKKGTGAMLFDEQSKVPAHMGYMNSSYFDEIYHARTAYEYMHGIVPYENTHPPLGKLLIAAGMEVFGVTPFGWRIVGTLFGIAMLPTLYVMALRLFGRTRYAALAAGLFALDFMHFTQTRISTIDVYGVFFIILMFYFMQRYVAMDFYRVPLRKTLWPLFWSGLFFGIGVASKWIVLYGGAGLAVMLFIALYDRYRQYRAARGVLERGSGDQELAAACRSASAVFWRNTVLTLGSCVAFFVLIPAAIYSLSFIPVLSVTGQGYTFSGLIEAQKNMYDYHSQLTATHPFASQWWQWPFMKRPVWFFSGGDGLPAGKVSSIVTMGNPVIWWTGIFALLAALWMTIKRGEKKLYVLWIGFFSQFIPWMLVPRQTFLYHYFAMVPFLILALVYMLKLADGRLAPKRANALLGIYAAAAAVLFVMFYPVLSGMQVTKDYVDIMLRWFPTWVF